MQITNEDRQFAEKLVAEGTQLISKDMIPHKVLGVWLSGSKLNGLSTDKSDTDLIAIVEDTPKEIMEGQPLSKQMVFEDEDNHFDIKMYGVIQVWRMIRKGNPNFIETFMEQPLAINEADPFMLTLSESQTIAKILHYNLPQFFKSCLGMANGTLKRKNATIKNYLQTIKNLKYARYMLTFPGTGRLDPDVGDSTIIGALTFINVKVHQDVPEFKKYFNKVLSKEINHLVTEIEDQVPKKAEGSDKLDKLFYNKVSQELIKPY